MWGAGPVVGRGPLGKLIRFTRDGVMMVFAATGAGKGLGIVVPTLLDYPGSILVTDPKGENYAITQRRRRSLGPVRMLNPADLTRSERFNPLDMIRVGTPLEGDDARALARLMIKPDAREAHWDDKATSLLTALILHSLREPPETRTLAHVRRLSVGGPEMFHETLTEIARSSASSLAAEIAAGFLSQSSADGDASAEFRSVLSNLHKATEPWSSGSPGGLLSSHSTFALDELVDQVSTLYLCVDEELLGVYERWLRVMTGCVLNSLMRAKDRPSPRHKVVLLLDEVSVLGPLEPLERQSGLLRAYCTPVLIWQNLPQVRAVYGDRAPALLANASCRVFFGVNDNETAVYVAEMLGRTTSLSISQGSSRPAESWFQRNVQEGISESGYWLLDAAEVQRLRPTRVIAKFRDTPFPLLSRRADYRFSRRWRGLWDNWRNVRTSDRGRGPADATHLLPMPSTSFQVRAGV